MAERKRTIVQLTTVHRCDDARIFVKQCMSLVRQDDLDVNLIVADGSGNTVSNGVTVHDVSRPRGGRIGRAVVGTIRIFRKARQLRPDLVHFHDPELIFAGGLLRLLGYGVIYDVHEDLPKQILTKYWIPLSFRRLISLLSAATMITYDGPEGLYRDSVSNKFFDSLAAGRPVFANFAGFSTRIAQQLEAGAILPRDDFDQGARLLVKHMANPAWMENASNRARKLGIQYFDREALSRLVEQSLLAATQQPSPAVTPLGEHFATLI